MIGIKFDDESPDPAVRTPTAEYKKVAHSPAIILMDELIHAGQFRGFLVRPLSEEDKKEFATQNKWTDNNGITYTVDNNWNGSIEKTYNELDQNVVLNDWLKLIGENDKTVNTHWGNGLGYTDDPTQTPGIDPENPPIKRKEKVKTALRKSGSKKNLREDQVI